MSKQTLAPIVIGSGITGASIAMMKPNVKLYDKARNPGGRVSTKTTKDNQIRFDFGATMFRDKMEIHWFGKVSEYNLFEIWNTNGISIATKPIYDLNHHYPIDGMDTLVSGMLKNHTPIQSMTLKSISQRENNDWSLSFFSNTKNQTESIYTSQLVLTLPIPQIIDLFQNSEPNPQFEKWIRFLEPYNDYRKTLVSLFSWNDWKPDLNAFGLEGNSDIPISTRLQRGDDWEYESWEHIKYPSPSNKGANLLVQFSALFSEMHFDSWMDVEKKPTPFYEEMLKNVVQEKWLAPPPDQIWNHRWKFAQAQMPLLGREGALKLDSEEFQEWISLCKETGIMILGDWLFGAKIERVIGGVHFLIHNQIL
ncbi:NAD(P)-binding protein [Leptospira sp. WS60.C2]